MAELSWHFPPSLVAGEIEKLLPSLPETAPRGLANLREAMRTGTLGSGKLTRPQLLLEAAALVGGPDFDAKRALGAACALELIHSYSLVHDDLPAMDDASTRRGKPCCHIQWGEANAILAGDALQTLAFEAITYCEGDAKTILSVVRLIAQAAGEAGMAGGQAIDLDWTEDGGNRQISEAELTQLHALKTGALIRVAAHAGAVLGGGTEEQIEALRSYGENLGRAFQLWDDVLDVIGDPEVMGKASSDAQNDKMTAPAVFGLENAQRMARESSENAVAALQSFGEEAQTLRNLARFVVERDK
ncbi:polyprenyl synthetase family protein [bacterium]|nr:MAG: polyprenyl synthetase family protein [bacterium]